MDLHKDSNLNGHSNAEVVMMGDRQGSMKPHHISTLIGTVVDPELVVQGFHLLRR
jgi:hypothetical protein